MATRSNGANSTGSLADGTDVALVEPGAGLLGEDAGDAFAVEVGPLVGSAVHSDRQVFQARGVDLLHRVLHDGLGVFVLERRQAALQIAAVVALIARLSDGAQKGVDGVAGAGGILLVRIGEVGGAHQAIVADVRLTREMMEHQHPLAEAAGAHLKARAVGGEGVVAEGPVLVAAVLASMNVC